MNESELLFTELLDCNRLSLYLDKDMTLDKDKSSVICSTLKRRISGEPLQYILGKTEFMGLEFKVTPDVLIPRPETEILVEMVIEIIQHLSCLVSRRDARPAQRAGLRSGRLRRSPALACKGWDHARSACKRPARNQAKPAAADSKINRPIKILDLGTGSGCIAISLAKMLADAKIDAIDISREALKIARINAELNGVKVNFIQSDLFNNHHLRLTAYDLIVSNPPYIPAAEIKNLQPELKYEPRIALDGGKDGLDFYRKIISGAADYLAEGGFLIMEMGFDQKEKIEDIFQKAKIFKIIEIVRDYNNIYRLVVAKKGQRQYG